MSMSISVCVNMLCQQCVCQCVFVVCVGTTLYQVDCNNCDVIVFPPDLDPAAEYQELDKAMKEGSVDYQGIDSVVVGIGGAGKTHTLAMVLNEPLPDKRVSTPCTKPPVRTVTQVTIGEDGGVLERVESEEYFSIFADTAREVAHSLPSTSQPPLVTICPVPHFMRELEEKMNQSLHREDPEEDRKPVQMRRLLYKLRWNRLTDSGGQPQFLEVLSIFLHHISLGIFVIKLNERLDAFPMIEFYNHAGNSVGTPYKSCYSQEQVIRHFMRALISQGGRRMGIKFLFIGTHRDRMEESKDESIQDKNEKLKKIIISFKMEPNVVYNGQDPLFAINAKSPQEEDLKVIGQVRRELVKTAAVPPIKIPIRSVSSPCRVLGTIATPIDISSPGGLLKPHPCAPPKYRGHYVSPFNL